MCTVFDVAMKNEKPTSNRSVRSVSLDHILLTQQKKKKQEKTVQRLPIRVDV